MRTRLLHRLLLAAVLLGGQWLAVAHATEHQALAADHACFTCNHAQDAGAGLAPATPVLRHVAAVAARVFDVVAAPSAAAVRTHPIRGPPSAER